MGTTTFVFDGDEVWTGLCRPQELGSELAIWDDDNDSYIPGRVIAINTDQDHTTVIDMQELQEITNEMPRVRFDREEPTPESRIEALQKTNSKLNQRVMSAESKIKYQERTINALTIALESAHGEV